MMQKKIITASTEAWAEIIAAILSSPHDIEVEDVGELPVKGHGVGRRQYRVINPERAEATLAQLGTDTIMGVIFSDLVDGTVKGKPLTTRDIRERRPAFNTNTIATDLVTLRQTGLIVSEAIVSQAVEAQHE